MKLVVAQLGSRMYYAVPRILDNAGMLSRFHTDLLGDRGWPRLFHLVPRRLRPAGLNRMLGRELPGISRSRVFPHNDITLRGQWRLSRAADSGAEAESHIWMGDELCRRALRRGLKNVDAVFVVGSSSRILFREAKRAGCRTIMESIIASPRAEKRLLEEEESRYPHWMAPGTAVSSSHFQDLVDEEYALADQIICGSPFVRESIRQSGGPVDRCAIVPYGVPLKVAANGRMRKAGDPLRVLTVGAVGLRKGIQYVAEAAGLVGKVCAFRLVGPLQAKPEIGGALAAQIGYLGAVPKAKIQEHYQWADVFLLPSICEGSATVIYEAMGFGLPIVTTFNSGSVVTDGKEGYVVPIRDPSAIARSLLALSENNALYERMSQAALATARAYSFDRYSRNLVKALKQEIQGNEAAAAGDD